MRIRSAEETRAQNYAVLEIAMDILKDDSLPFSEAPQKLITEITQALPQLSIDGLLQISKIIAAHTRKTLTIAQAAEFLGVSTVTLRRSIKNGTLKTIRLSKAGNHRILREELNRLVAEGTHHG